jgi:hypothetical protein
MKGFFNMRWGKESLLLIFFLSQIKIYAIEQKFPVSASLINHTWAFPFQQVFRIKPFYPGGVAGTEYVYKENKRSRLFQTLNLGFFLNKTTGSAVFLASDFGYRYTTKFGVFADVSLGLGYLHAFYPRKIYRQNEQNEYVKVHDIGKPVVMVSTSFSLGYDCSKKTSLPLSPFIKYQWFAQYPYFELIPIRPNGILHLGLRYNWK